jgi:peptide deformylase
MSLLTIITYPDPFLRLKAKQVTSFDKDFQMLVDNMFETMREAPGVGLAAPQIGESLRLVVVEYTDDEHEEAKPKRFVLVNPELVETSEETEIATEACLSLPGLAGEVERHYTVKLKAQNRFGKPIKVKAEDWLARIFQHEIDHLDGVLYTDRATRVFQPSQEEAENIKD